MNLRSFDMVMPSDMNSWTWDPLIWLCHLIWVLEPEILWFDYVVWFEFHSKCLCLEYVDLDWAAVEVELLVCSEFSSFHLISVSLHTSIGAQRVKNMCVAFRNFCEEKNLDGWVLHFLPNAIVAYWFNISFWMADWKLCLNLDRSTMILGADSHLERTGLCW